MSVLRKILLFRSVIARALRPKQSHGLTEIASLRSGLAMAVRKGMLISLLACSTILPAQTSGASEYHVKAVFLFNFTQFVQWPSASFASAQSPLIIGILGGNPFGSYLEDVVAGEKINGHPLVIYNYNSIEEVNTCHILFINKSQAGNMNSILTSLKGKSTLTVSDASGFLQQGGMVRFFTRNNKINLQINLDAAKAAKLDISSKLLRLAEIFAAN